MSEPEPLRPFIPAWLDDMELTPVEFRLLAHLCRRMDRSTGIAWPSYDGIMERCKVSRATVWRSLKTLEARNLIARSGKPFGGSARYIVLPSIVSPEERLEANSFTSGTNGSAPIVSPVNSNRSPSEASIVSPEEREGTLKKVHQEGKTRSTIIETIYSAYPRKVGKPPALKAIEKALKKIDGNELLAIVKSYAAAITWQERRFIPHPATWFNGERWEDDPAEWKEPTTGQPQQSAPMSFGLRKPAGQKFIRETIGCENYTDDLPTAKLPT